MKSRIPQTFIQDVVARTDIVPLIQSRIDLKKRGNSFMANCPFHSEKTPSFTVSDSKQFYYCFGCGAHGNVISFLMEYDRLPFMEAITYLAEQLGLRLPIEAESTESTNYNALYTVLDEAKKLYQKKLAQTPLAIQYLQNRGLTGEIARDFAIGYAPDEWEFIFKIIGKNREQRSSLATAGMLIEKSPDRYYDRFRHRIIFPIRDLRGRTIAFGGRVISEGTPKYLNSPETPVFHKQKTLYGLYEACQKHRQLKQIIVVEGYLDVISLAQHGIHYAVATLGTAFNIQHIQILARHTSDVIFCFDGDTAGQHAAWKALIICLPILRDGFNIRFLFLPAKEDPDSWVQKIKRDAFEQHIQQAKPLSDVFFQQLKNDHPIDSIAGKAAFAKQADHYLKTMPSGIFKDLLYTQLSDLLHIPREQLTQLLQSASKTETHHAIERVPAPQSDLPKLGKRLTPLQTAIQLLLHQPNLIAQTDEIPHWQSHEKTAEIHLFLQLIQHFSKRPTLTLGELLLLLDSDTDRQYIATIAAHPIHIPSHGYATEFTGALQRVREQHQTNHLSRLIEKAKHTELDPEEKQLLQLLLLSKQAAI